MKDFTGLSVNTFAIAFLIGFGIDVFFTALDRLMSFLQNMVAPPRPPTTPTPTWDALRQAVPTQPAAADVKSGSFLS